MEPIERRADADGCACLRCRSLDPVVYRRTLGDHLVWSVGVVRRHATIMLAVAIVVGLELFQRRVGLVPTHSANIFDVSLLAVVPALAFRGYVATIAAGELSGTRQTVGQALGHTLRRLPAILAAMAGTLFVAGIAMVIATVAVTAIFTVVYPLDMALGIGVVTPAIFDTAFSPLVFGSAMAAVIFKCWLAPEICVAGGYGPLTALRMSWSITATHRRRLLVVVGGFALTILAPYAVGPAFAAAGVGHTLDSSWLVGLGSAAQLSLQAIWVVLGTAMYVSSVVDREDVEVASGQDLLATGRKRVRGAVGRIRPF
ncbi:hypothetical protein [Halovivax gelatinilyticus]|uniref:hypothetical protein n=1 Tax=Halovivax gelatinilyticus TaxID=2961597 RepID=UPI0020CA82E7|nr:hypothetical protein [Halovivax gelatinilyticus]